MRVAKCHQSVCSQQGCRGCNSLRDTNHWQLTTQQLCYTLQNSVSMECYLFHYIFYSKLLYSCQSIRIIAHLRRQMYLASLELEKKRYKTTPKRTIILQCAYVTRLQTGVALIPTTPNCYIVENTLEKRSLNRVTQNNTLFTMHCSQTSEWMTMLNSRSSLSENKSRKTMFLLMFQFRFVQELFRQND